MYEHLKESHRCLYLYFPKDIHMLMLSAVDFIGSAEFLLWRSMVFKLKEDLEAEDQTPSSREMTSVVVSCNDVLRRLGTIKPLFEDLQDELTHRAEESISRAESEGEVESFD